MTIRMTTWIIFCAIVFANCTQEDHLLTDVTIQQLPSCDGTIETLIDIDINTGEAPFILQVVRSKDQRVIYDEKTNDYSNTLSVPNLIDIEYDIVVKSSNFETASVPKEIYPTGVSSLEAKFEIESGDRLIPFANVPVTLYLSESRNSREIAQLITNDSGQVQFGNLPTGDYFIEVRPGDKFSNFKITAQDEDGNSIISEDQYETVLVPMTCNNDKSLEIQYIKG